MVAKGLVASTPALSMDPALFSIVFAAFENYPLLMLIVDRYDAFLEASWVLHFLYFPARKSLPENLWYRSVQM